MKAYIIRALPPAPKPSSFHYKEPVQFPWEASFEKKNESRKIKTKITDGIKTGFYSEEEKKQMIYLRAHGCSYPEIAKRLGRNKYSVKTWFQKRGREYR